MHFKCERGIVFFCSFIHIWNLTNRYIIERIIGIPTIWKSYFRICQIHIYFYFVYTETISIVNPRISELRTESYFISNLT